MIRIEGLDQTLQMFRTYYQTATDDVKDLVKESAYKIEQVAKARCPVDTGRLRASITTSIDEGANDIVAKVGTPVEYAHFVEYGTYKQDAQPYLTPAFNQVKSQFISQLKSILERGG